MRKERGTAGKAHRILDTFMVYILLPLEMLFSNSISAGSVLGVKMVALEEARAKGRAHSTGEEEGGEKGMLGQQPTGQLYRLTKEKGR